jgi:hypothetical protein
MGDDDNLDFSDCHDVIDAIGTGRFDLISLGSMAQRPEERGVTATVRELVERGTRYFSTFTFITGVIFRPSSSIRAASPKGIETPRISTRTFRL